MIRRSALLALFALLVLAGPAAALGADRYASPSGNPYAPCTHDSPCDLVSAVNGAAAGDTVHVASGGYRIAGSLMATGITVDGEGAGGGEYPTVVGNFGAPLISATGLNTTVRHLRLIQHSPATAVSSSGGTTFDNLFVERTGGSSSVTYGIVLGDGDVLRDSVVWAPAQVPNVWGVRGGASALDNLTVVVAGPGSSAIVGTSSPTALRIRNTIARGSNYDIASLASDVGYSNFRPTKSTGVTDGGHNQPADPRFTDPAGGNFRPLPGSPVQDAGTAADPSYGDTDVEGFPRAAGLGPDIGAYERPAAPSATTGSASGVSTTRATLSGTLDSRGRGGIAYFQFGRDTSYGQQTGPHTLSAAGGARSFSASIAELTPGARYHFRLVVVVAGAVARGADASFVTPPVCSVPRLSGQSLSRARRLLERAHCRLGRVSGTRHGRRIVVIAQNPRAGSTRRAGTAVAVKLGRKRR